MSKIKLTDACNITTGKLDSNAAVKGGKYPYFTCAPEPLAIDDYAFDDDVIVLAGNNAAGNFHCQRYNGKFNAYQRTYVITAKEDYDIDYIYYNLVINLQHFRKVAQGSQTKFLTMDIFNSFELEDIPMTEQLQTVECLKHIDKAIKNNVELRHSINSLIKKIYDYWFVQYDFDNHGLPYKHSGGEFEERKDNGEIIPKGWSVVTYEECIKSINTGLNPRDNFVLNCGGSIKYVTVKNLTIDGIIDFDGCDFVDEEAREIIHKRSDIEIGDILFASIAPLGRCYLINEEPENWDINESVFSIRPNKEKVTSRFLYGALTSDMFVKAATHAATGSIFKGIRIGDLQKMKLVLPPLDIVKEFDRITKEMFDLRELCFNNYLNLIKVRDKLLPLTMAQKIKYVGKLE